MKCIDVAIVCSSKTGTDNNDPVFARRMPEMREVASLAIKPLAHGIERIGQAGLTDAYFDGPHGEAPCADLAGALVSLSHRGPMVGPMMAYHIWKQSPCMSPTEHNGRSGQGALLSGSRRGARG